MGKYIIAHRYGLTLLQVITVNFRQYRIFLPELLLILGNFTISLLCYTTCVHRDAVLTFKCVTGTTPDCLSQQCVNRGSTSERYTRNSKSLNIPQKCYWPKIFYYGAVSLWNSIPEDIKTSTSINTFKHKPQRHLLETFLYS